MTAVAAARRQRGRTEPAELLYGRLLASAAAGGEPVDARVAGIEPLARAAGLKPRARIEAGGRPRRSRRRSAGAGC